VLKQRPRGEIQQGDLVLEERPVRSPGEGEVVAQVLWLSLDPYMRPRMNDAKGYMDPIGIDEPIVGESVARVVESRSDDLKVGDLVTCYSGWQEYVTFPADAPMVYKIQQRDNVPLQAYLGVARAHGLLRSDVCGQAESRRNRGCLGCFRTSGHRRWPDCKIGRLQSRWCCRRA
jgi:NADPH-dependent curcumin reductase CurA